MADDARTLSQAGGFVDALGSTFHISAEMRQNTRAMTLRERDQQAYREGQDAARRWYNDALRRHGFPAANYTAAATAATTQPGKSRTTPVAGPGWTVDDAPEAIWDVSVHHLGEAVRLFAPGGTFEALMSPLLAAQLGFRHLRAVGYRPEHSGPLSEALAEWSEGLVVGDKERVNAGYRATEAIVKSLG